MNVPEGASEIVAHFDFLSSQGGSQGRVVMTPEMLNLQWNANRCIRPASTRAQLHGAGQRDPAQGLVVRHCIGDRAPRG